MPRGDGSGPNSFGPMTGKSLGFCAGVPVPGYMNYNSGRFGRRPGGGRFSGRGGGMRCNARFNFSNQNQSYIMPKNISSTTQKSETEFLKNRAEYLQNELNAINQRLRDLETSAESD